MRINPYLNFAGTTEAAFRFYAQVLGGTLTDIFRFGSMPGGGDLLATEQKDLVMHVGLRLPNGQMILGTDAIEGMGPPFAVGTNISLSLHPTSTEEADRIFSALSEGGTVTMPIGQQFWGDYYGALVDRFGIQWMVNYSSQDEPD